MNEIPLEQFVLGFKNQAEAGAALGCNQSAISQALKDIEMGKRQVVVKKNDDGTLSADSIKPFGKDK